MCKDAVIKGGPAQIKEAQLVQFRQSFKAYWSIEQENSKKLKLKPPSYLTAKNQNTEMIN